MVAMIDYDKAEELINAHRGYGMVVLIDDELPAHGTVGDVTVCRFDTDPERLIEIMMDLENEREIAGKPLNLAIAVSKSREEEFGDDRDRHGWRLLRDATVYHVADRWTIKGLEMDEQARTEEAEEEEEDEPTDLDIIVATYGEKALDAGYIVTETRDYRAEEIFEHFCATEDDALELAEDIWDRLSREERKRTTVVASFLSGFDIVDDIAIDGATVWSSRFEGMVLRALRVRGDATSAIVHTVRDGVETSVAWGEGSDCRMPDLEHFLKLVREDAVEHPGRVSVEFFEDFEGDDGNPDCRSLGLFEVD